MRQIAAAREEENGEEGRVIRDLAHWRALSSTVTARVDKRHQ